MEYFFALLCNHRPNSAYLHFLWKVEASKPGRYIPNYLATETILSFEFLKVLFWKTVLCLLKGSQYTDRMNECVCKIQSNTHTHTHITNKQMKHFMLRLLITKSSLKCDFQEETLALNVSCLALLCANHLR